ncbi:hypothetical protein [Paenibacillus donghaensis]|uniref:Dipeptidylpeptidase IV N-terminal domain-containing protein n=1 Tax=Paenibacillus donghaensis TaxID=414771 RepID=A0A2Z2KY07_9BACL|nr:hypothetical protein [Paenibacillus donghaensis]ASA25238.1 hypothetical protein B9T62_33610 [Paenibacillus donghaensis]
MKISTTGIYSATAWIALGLVVLLISGCGTKDTEARQVVQKDGTAITVLDNTAESVYTSLKLERIDRIDELRGMDWIDEDTLVVSRENRQLNPETIEGEARYPRNLYRYELASASQSALVEGDHTYGSAQFSPDKRHMFYMELYESTGMGYIMDMASGQSVKLDDKEFMMDEGVWADDAHVIYSDMEGAVKRADLKGASEAILQVEGARAQGAVQSGNVIYYIVGGEAGQQLFAWDGDTKTTAMLSENVTSVLPSPDGSRLALHKRIGPGKVELLLSDAEGKTLSTVASGMQVFGTNWSPDGSKLAYAVSENGDQYRFFIMELETGEQTEVLGNNDVSDQLQWSPSGKKLMIPTGELKDNVYKSTTYIINLS